MKILIHTPYYPPEIGAPQARLSALAEALTVRGHEVTVLTAVPNYPLGRFYPGENIFFSRSTRNGVKIIRIFIFPSKSKRIFPRLVSYLSFAFSSLFIGSWFCGKADVVITESPPIFLGPAGYMISILKGARWIFNVSDLWPESAAELGKIKRDSVAYRLCRKLENFCYRKAFAVSGQSCEIVEYIKKQSPDTCVTHLSNGVDIEKFGLDSVSGDIRDRLGGKDKIICLYAGLLGMAQGLEHILEAASELRDDREILFVLVGDGPEKAELKKKAENQGLKNVVFLEPLSADQVPRYLNAADMVIVCLKQTLTGAVPSKLYEAMASCKPVVLVASGEPAKIVRESRCGFVSEPGKLPDLKENILSLARNPSLRQEMGESGRKAVSEKYDRNRIHQEFETFLREQVCR